VNKTLPVQTYAKAPLPYQPAVAGDGAKMTPEIPHLITSFSLLYRRSEKIATLPPLVDKL
jgi:hypothetical protein